MIKLLTAFFLFINCSFIYAEKGSFSMSGAGLANMDVIKQGNNTFIIADVKIVLLFMMPQAIFLKMAILLCPLE